MIMEFKSRTFLSVLSLFLGLSVASATTLTETGIDEMTQQSSAIVVADVTSSQSVTIDGAIFTVVSLNVNNVLKGNVGTTADILVPGGSVRSGNFQIGEVNAGAPALYPDNEVVLFLTAPNAQGQYQVMGFSQGQVNVIDNGEEKLVRVAELGNTLTLAAFTDRIETVLASQ